MRDPKIIGVVQEGATYTLPVYKVTPEGIVDAEREQEIKFCKGSKNDPEIFNQEGVFTESIIEVARQYLTSVNTGELSTRETSMAITKLDEALMWLDKRSQDRKRREVQGTYQK